ncbi:MAG TPA: non-homologous end-joining DNA ligase [Candidatus Baltobacteraceae bacterium]|nr:non-homologous end-joining DNA ligase [Candidatus Baltobacteraceae bacterium]
MARGLETYNKKRDFTATPEPSGKLARGGKRLRFVIQKHRATRLHYDFRLEAGGAMPSWAVPKGPTLVPGERRLAMHVEDHPLDYRTFEGVIPKGQYGAGEVIVWDEGWYQLAEGTDPVKEIANGKIKFILHGKKLQGMFTLVKMKPREGEHGEPWLLIKDHDEYDRKSYDIDDYPDSAKSGKTIADIQKESNPKTWQSRPKDPPPKRRARASAKADPLPTIKGVELATLIDGPFDDDDWLFEIKWDGYRAICTIDAKGKLTLVSRNGLDLLKQFPPLAGLADAFESVPIIVDGEIVSVDSKGKSDFQRLQEYGQKDYALSYAAFDVLYADGRDQRKTPLEERKALLERLIGDDELVLYSKHVVGKGKALFTQAKRRHLEGIMGKKRASPYVGRRTRDWVKIKAQLEQEFVIGGWTDPRGSRKGFGSLLLGAYDGEDLRFIGNVGTGFSVKRIEDIMKKLKPLAREKSPFVNPVIANSPAHYVKPQLVAEVRFAEWTRDLLLRQPAFLGLRTDKAAKDVVLELPQQRKGS